MSSFSDLMASYDQQCKRNLEILSKFSVQSGYEIVQTNGQRVCGPPPHLAVKRYSLKGAEVFIGKLPRDCMEDEIFQFVSRAGEVYRIRLMVNFSGENRGYCFVTFCSFQSAFNAVCILNNTFIRPGHRVGVALSSDNTRLELTGIDARLDADKMSDELKTNTEGFVDIEVKMADRRSLNNFLLEYNNHRNTALAKRYIRAQIGEGSWGPEAHVKWAFCPLTDARNKKKKENRLKKIKEGCAQNFSLDSYSGRSADAMSVVSNVSNKENVVSNFHSSGAASQYNITTPSPRGIPILGQASRQNSAQLRNPMTESGFNSRLSSSTYTDSRRQSARPSPPQYDEEGAAALLPPHFDIMGTNSGNYSLWSGYNTDNAMDWTSETPENTSNSGLSWYEETLMSAPQKKNNLNDPGLPTFYNNLSAYNLLDLNLPNESPEPPPLSRSNSMISNGSWSNFDNDAINKFSYNKVLLAPSQNVKWASGLSQLDSSRSVSHYDGPMSGGNISPMISWEQYKQEVLSKSSMQMDTATLNQSSVRSQNMQGVKNSSVGSSANHNQGVNKYPLQKVDTLSRNAEMSRHSVDWNYSMRTNGLDRYNNDFKSRENDRLENILHAINLSDRQEGRLSLHEVRDFTNRL